MVAEKLNSHKKILKDDRTRREQLTEITLKVVLNRQTFRPLLFTPLPIIAYERSHNPEKPEIPTDQYFLIALKAFVIFNFLIWKVELQHICY
jgi:hypothetical protein